MARPNHRTTSVTRTNAWKMSPKNHKPDYTAITEAGIKLGNLHALGLRDKACEIMPC
jgi:hypothetical protein